MNNQNDPIENIAFDILRDIRQNDGGNESGSVNYNDNDADYARPQSSALMKTAATLSAPMVAPNTPVETPRQASFGGEFGTAPREVIKSHRDSLSGLQRFLFNRQIGKLRRVEAEKISKAWFEREFETTLQKLTLSMDIEKKKTFISYLRSSASLQRELQQLDAEACLSLTQSLMDINIQIYTAENRNEKLIDGLLQKGVIKSHQAVLERQKNRELMERNLSGALVTLDHLWNNHKKLLEQTLKVTIDKLIVEGAL